MTKRAKAKLCLFVFSSSDFLCTIFALNKLKWLSVMLEVFMDHVKTEHRPSLLQKSRLSFFPLWVQFPFNFSISVVISKFSVDSRWLQPPGRERGAGGALGRGSRVQAGFHGEGCGASSRTALTVLFRSAGPSLSLTPTSAAPSWAVTRWPVPPQSWM